MKLTGIIPELKMSEGTHFAEHYLKKMESYPILSINTSSLFNGDLHCLKLARTLYPKKYLIRKDFIMIPRQIEESKKAGANAVLLIHDLLRPEQYLTLLDACKQFHIEPIVEIDGTKKYGILPNIILVNSRRLNSGDFDKPFAEITCNHLRIQYKNKNIIYASGEQSNRVVKKGIADAVLIGTAFIKGKCKHHHI